MTFPFGRFMKQVIIPMVILGMFTYCIVYCIKYVIPDESFIRLMITCLMSSVLLCLSVFGLGINVDEKNLISGIIIKKSVLIIISVVYFVAIGNNIQVIIGGENF